MENENDDLTKEGNFVWAKLSGPKKLLKKFMISSDFFFTGHPFWPGQIVSEGPGLKSRSGTIVVKFFASNDYAQVKPDQLKAYKPGEKQTPGKKQRKV